MILLNCLISQFGLFKANRLVVHIPCFFLILFVFFVFLKLVIVLVWFSLLGDEDFAGIEFFILLLICHDLEGRLDGFSVNVSDLFDLAIVLLLVVLVEFLVIVLD